MATGDETMVNPVNGISTEHMTAVVVLSALGFLILMRRGFRGVSVGIS